MSPPGCHGQSADKRAACCGGAFALARGVTHNPNRAPAQKVTMPTGGGETREMPRRSLALFCAAALLWPTLVLAETDTIKIPRGAGGVGFLPLLVMEQKGLIERHAREAGLADLKVEWIKLGGPA